MLREIKNAEIYIFRRKDDNFADALRFIDSMWSGPFVRTAQGKWEYDLFRTLHLN